MGREARDGLRDLFLYAVLRPLLFVFWSMVLWGTCLGVALAGAMLRHGAGAALRRVTAGSDPLAGRVNLGLIALAVVVWSLVAIAFVHSRRRRRVLEAAPPSPENDRLDPGEGAE